MRAAVDNNECDSNDRLTRMRWRYLALACFINLFAGSIYAWSVFASALAEKLTETLGRAVTTGDLALAFGIANGLAPIPMIFGGVINDRFGPRALIATGGLLMGGGYILTGFAESVSAVIFSFGLFFGIGLAFVYGPAVNTTMKFFPDRRGLAGGLTTAAYGISSVMLPPVASWLIAKEGISAAMVSFGALFAVVTLLSAFGMKKCPDGFRPAGWTPTKPISRASVRDRNWRAMIASSEFLPMLALLMCGATSALMVISLGHTIAVEQMGMRAAAASAVVSFVAFANTLGRIAAGSLSDRLGSIETLSLGILCAVFGLGLLGFSTPDTVFIFYAGLSLLGVSFGAFMGVYPGFTAEVFGAKHNSVNFGIIFAGFSAAGILGPSLMGMLRLNGMSFGACYLAAGAVSLAGLIFVWIYRKQAR